MPDSMLFCLGVLLIAALASDVASAASSGGSGLPWETPLQTLRDSITAPVAYAISPMAVVAAPGERHRP